MKYKFFNPISLDVGVILMGGKMGAPLKITLGFMKQYMDCRAVTNQAYIYIFKRSTT